MGQFNPLVGLAAAVEQKRKLFEAQHAASGDDAKAGLRAAKPKDEEAKPKEKVAPAKPAEYKTKTDSAAEAELRMREAREQAKAKK